jgi:hypothetical protein
MTEILSTTVVDSVWNSGSKDVRDMMIVGGEASEVLSAS